MHDIFVEQLGNMVVGTGLVRLDFMRIETGAGGKEGQLQPGTRLVIPLAAFAQAVDALVTLRDQLVTDGVLTRSQGEPPTLKN